VLMVKIKTSSSTYYTVEYRTKDDWDEGFPGPAVYVHYYNNSPQGGETFGESVVQVSSVNHQAMQPGEHFVTSSGGITVNVVSFNAQNGTAQVSVQY